MSDTEPRYYDPETGDPTEAAQDACTELNEDIAFPPAYAELARLQRERDEALAELEGERERDEALEHMSALSCTQGKAGLVAKVEALISDLVDTAFAQGIAESEAATLRAELRQARRREKVMLAGVLPDPSHSDDKRLTLRIVSCWSHSDARLAALNTTLYNQPFTSPAAALDAAWTALHDAGLVEDEDHE